MKNIKKTILHMYLPQTKSKPVSELYDLFKKRVRRKSKDNYVDKSKNPTVLILNINHPIMDFQEGVLVKYGSFEVVTNGKDQEIGFSAIIYSGFSNDTYFLRVFKKGKAFLEKLDN